MVKLLVILAILLFIVMQLAKLKPSKRDRQLQRLRDSARREGLQVVFWTASSQRYQHRSLPGSGFQYLLPAQDRDAPQLVWALWIDSQGERSVLAGVPPEQAHHFVVAFQRRYSDGWLLLEQRADGLAALWQERGTEQDVVNLAQGLRVLREQLQALPG